MSIKSILKISATLPLYKSVVVNLLYTNQIIDVELNKVLKPNDISLQQFNVLRILKGQKGKPVSLSKIQERMIAKMSNTTRLVDKLILKGFVKKKTNKANKRKIDVCITDRGLNFLDTINTLIEYKEKDIVANLSKEEATELIRLLSKLRLIEN